MCTTKVRQGKSSKYFFSVNKQYRNNFSMCLHFFYCSKKWAYEFSNLMTSKFQNLYYLEYFLTSWFVEYSKNEFAVKKI
jgi:hypothetical protein